MVAGCPVQEVGCTLHHSCDALAPALIKDGRIRNAMDDPPPQHRVILLCFPDAPCLLHRIDAQAFVGSAGTAVQFPDAVEPALLVCGVPPYREGL